MRKDKAAFHSEAEVSKFVTNLRTLVFEQTYMDDDGFLTKRIRLIKDRSNERALNRDFCVCTLDDLRKLAILYNSGDLFVAPEGIDKERLDLWVLGNGTYPNGSKNVDFMTTNLSQPHFIQIYKRKLLTNKVLGNYPHDQMAKKWESTLGIPLLAPKIQQLAGYVFLYDPSKGISIPLKMSPTRFKYKIKMVNLSMLGNVCERLAKSLDARTMLVIVVDMPEIAALIPLVHSGEIPAIADIALTPISLTVPYDSAMNNCIDI